MLWEHQCIFLATLIFHAVPFLSTSFHRNDFSTCNNFAWFEYNMSAYLQQFSIIIANMHECFLSVHSFPLLFSMALFHILLFYLLSPTLLFWSSPLCILFIIQSSIFSLFLPPFLPPSLPPYSLPASPSLSSFSSLWIYSLTSCGQESSQFFIICLTGRPELMRG